MNKFSVNDWLTLQTRKDLTYIRRSLEHESIDYAIFADLFIALFSFVLDHVLWTVTDERVGAVEQITPAWYWIGTACFLVIVPVIIFIHSYYKKRRYQADVKMVMPVDYFINLFDNEICYNAMTADSMRDHLLDKDNKLEEEIRKFYFIETLYYANKTTTQLYYFKNQGKNAIHTKNTLEGISYIRFRNLCEIVNKIYKALLDFASKNESYTALLEDSDDYIENYNDLVAYMCEIPGLEDMKKWEIH